LAKASLSRWDLVATEEISAETDGRQPHAAVVLTAADAAGKLARLVAGEGSRTLDRLPPKA
jgi:hypothetical protein